MGISGNMQSLSQLCACYGVPRVTQGFTTLFIGETFAVYIRFPFNIISCMYISRLTLFTQNEFEHSKGRNANIKM